MGWLIAVLGTGLTIAGTMAIYFGAPYIQVEWGYSEVIAGTTALSAGIVAIALAAILFAIHNLAKTMTAGTARSTVAGGIAPGFDLETADPRSAIRLGTTPATSEQRIAEGPRAPDLGRVEPAPLPLGPEPDAWAPHRAEPASGRSETRATPRPEREPALFRPTDDAPPAAADAPTVVGRYEANGASYVLFSDGTIEVESATGTHRYASMQDLRDHIERQGGPS